MQGEVSDITWIFFLLVDLEFRNGTAEWCLDTFCDGFKLLEFKFSKFYSQNVECVCIQELTKCATPIINQTSKCKFLARDPQKEP